MSAKKFCILILVFLQALTAFGKQQYVSDSVLLSVRSLPLSLLALPPVVGSGDLYRGGVDDGFAASCLLPIIIEYGQQNFECISDSIVMWIKADGTEREYKWQKYDANAFHDLENNLYLTGVKTDRLVVRTPDKLRDDGVYRCVVFNGCGETLSDTFRVVMSSAPQLVSSIGSSVSWECAGHRSRNLAIAVSCLDEKLLSYTWWKLDTVTGERILFDLEKHNTGTLTIQPLSLEDEGLYGVTVSNECGTLRDSAFMPVYMPVTVEEMNVVDRNIIACEGESVDFRVKVAGGGVYHYTLKKVRVTNTNPLVYQDIATLSTGQSQYTINGVDKSMVGEYVWEVENNCGRDTSEVIRLEVHQHPDFTAGKEFPDTLVCEGAKVVLSCEAVGENVKYYWYHNGEPTPIVGNILQIDTLNAERAGNYICYAHNVCLRHSSARPIQVTMDPLPDIMRQPLLLKPVCVGDSLVEINIRFGNTPPDSLRWRFNDHFLYDDEKKIAGSTLNKLSIFNIKPEEIGYYYVQAYNRCGSVISEAAELKLNEPARIIKGLNGYNMLLCAGEDQQLMINATGTKPLRYRWLCNDRVFATSEENIVHVKAGDINVDAQYCVQVENMCGSEVQCSFLKVAKIQTFKIEGGGEYCDGHNATGAFNMIGSDTNVMYSLYRDPDEKINEFKGTGDTIQFKEMASGHYYITGLDSNGCVQQMKNPVDVILKSSPASGRLVMLNESCQNNPGANLVMTNWEDKVQYKLYRKYKTADYEWYKYLMFLGGSVNSPQPGEVKEWNGLDEGRYKVVAQNLMNGCTRDMVLDDSVILRPAPRRYNLLAVHNDLINCSLDNELVQLEADAYENGSEYILKKEGVAYGQSLRYSPIRWSLLGGGSYTLLVKNQWGCMSESKPVKVVDALTPTQVKISGNGAICDGDVSTYKELIVEKSELGVTYRLLKDFPERFIEEKKGTGSDMKFILPLSNATYIVDAYDATGQCKVRLEDRFLVGGSKFQAVTVPAELFLDRGGRTHLHVDVSGTYAQPMAIEWKPKEMIEWGLVTSPTTQWHKQYHIPFCPCQCSLDYPNYHEYVHGPQCASNPTSCPYLYHTWDPKKYGCIYQKTERILWRGEMKEYYDLYYCPKSFQDDYQITNEAEGTPNPFKDPTTVPIYQDITYQVTATDALGCSKMDEVKVKVTGKKLDAEIIFSKEHKHFYAPFCPCRCPDGGGGGHDTHGPGCNDTNCWLFYHSHTHSGCSFQKTEKIFYEGSWRNYYDLYYCCTGIEAVDTMVYRNDEQFFCSSVDGGDYTYKYVWSFVTADGVGTVFPEGKEHVQFQARESGYLYLDVTSMGQHKKDSIWIEVLRKPLKAEIRNSECELRVDSVSLCIGERTELCGWAEGGDGPHTYRWYDREHDLASLNHVIYKPEKSDYVWFLTASDGVEVLDSVFIKLSPSPQKVAIDAPGVRCVQLDQEEVIRMPKTQKGMNYILEYRAPGLANREYGQRYNNAQGDALAFSVHQPVHDPGMYRVRVDHTIGDKVCSIYLDSIEFIAPPADAEIVDTTYCFGDFGVALQLKSVADNMQYSIVSAKGTVLETIKKPEVQFHKLYTQAPYFFRMERLGELGSCWLERPFQVSRAQDPDISLAVVANAHGPVCEGSEITITVLKTEKGVKYELISPTNRVEDMLMGSGLDESFKAFPRPAGIYMIRATRGNCDVYLDQSVKVNPLPRNLDISDIHYCVTPPQQAVQVKTTVEVGGLQTNVRYYLRLKNVDLDSVEGPGIKTFEKQQTAGEYQILAKDLTTQCVSPVNVFHIVGDRGPYPFELLGGCGASQEVHIATSEPSVTYTLHRDHVPVAALSGSGAPLTFGVQTISGIYSVWAKNDTTGCETLMKGVVGVYELGTCELKVVGSICKVGGDGSIELHYPCSKTGWSYFIEKVTGTKRERSNIQMGTGGELWWNKIGKILFRQGVYELFACNECDTLSVKTVEVFRREGPVGKIIPIVSACRDQEVEIVVTGGNSELKYTLLANVGGFRKVLNEKMGENIDFSMGRYMNYEVYRLAAAYPDGGCYKEISSVLVERSATPNPLDIIGKDVCKKMVAGVEDGNIELCLPSKEPDVNYYLLKGSERKFLDTIFAKDPQTCFELQRDTGCYYVFGVNAKTNCQDTMNGIYCMGGLPEPFDLVIDNPMMIDTAISMCVGDVCGIILKSSSVDARYQLYLDGVIPVGKERIGNGSMMLFQGISQAGTYTVVAENGCGRRNMNNPVTVTVGDIPDMIILNPYYYCPDKAGATITIQNTERGSKFDLCAQGKDWMYTVLETKESKETGSTVTFDYLPKENAAYRIKVLTRYGCKVERDFIVKKDTLPHSSFKLSSTTDSVICEASCTELHLSGSEENVEYYLYNDLLGEMALKIGEGGPLNFGKMCQQGIYSVMAYRHYVPRCSSRIDNTVKLLSIDTIRELKISTTREFFCNGDPNLSTIQVANAQAGITYQLFLNGLPTARKITPNADGTTIFFEKLMGGTCEKPNIYTLKASNSSCSKFMLNSVRIISENLLNAGEIKFTPERKIECCEGDTVAFKTEVNGCNLKYTWYQDANLIAPVTSHCILEKVKAGDAGIYSCKVENSCGRVEAGRVELKITPRPVLLQDIQSVAFCEGKNAYISSAMDYVHTGDYKWYRTYNKKDSVYSTTPFLEFIKISKEDAGEYICEGFSACSSVRDTFMIEVDVNADSLKIAKIIDTLCVGSVFSAQIAPMVSYDKMEWSFNGVATGVKGYVYNINQVQMKDDGIYSIAMNNACGIKDIPVKQLIVDDSIRILDQTMDQVSCANVPMDLYVIATPTVRMKYTWYEGSTFLGEGAKLNTIVGKNQSQRTYRVFCRNACGSKYSDVNLKISGTFEIDNPPAQIELCANPLMDTTLCVTVRGTTVYSYQWFFQPKKVAGKVDTLGKMNCETISALTNHTGFYWCKMETECRPISSTATWLKIDTVPSISALPDKDTLCVKGSQEYSVDGSGGGGLVYDWKIRYKDGRTESLLLDEGKDFFSTSTCIVGPVTQAWDSAVIVCYAYNKCGNVQTNEMLLRIDKSRELIIHPFPDTTICEGGYAHIRVELKNGVYPWYYRYRDTVGREEARIVSNSLVDEFDLDRSGKYSVLFDRDGHSCNYAEGDLGFEIKTIPTPVAKIAVVGEDTLCPGEKGQVRVEISYPSLKGKVIPSGPWEVKFIRKDGSIADELSVSDPYYIYKQSELDTVVVDTLKPFGLSKSMTYYIGSIKDMGQASGIQCSGQPMDSAVFYQMARDTLKFDFRSERDTLGGCNVVKLDTLLNPNMDGEFYIDGIKSQLGIFNSPPLAPGKHIIKYKTVGNCPMSNDSVRLWVMPKPKLTVVPRDTALCPGESVNIQMNAIGMGPLKLKYDVRNIKRDGSLSPAPQNFEVAPPKTLTISNSMLDDSLRIITPMYLIDRFDCWADKVDTLQSVVKMRRYPIFKLYGRHPNYDNGGWSDWTNPYLISAEDTVEFKISLIYGVKPWSYSLIKGGKEMLVGPISGTDTIFKAYEESHYQFSVIDGCFCSKPTDKVEKDVFFREAGYLRIKLLLEGAYNDAGGLPLMHSKLQKYNLLPKRGLDKWPVNGKDSIVDWVVVEARDKIWGPSVSSDTFLLRNDGMLITSTGNDTLNLRNATKLWGSNPQYIVVKHRNHISIMSAMSISVVDLANKKNVFTLDLTQKANLYCPPSSNIELHAQKLTDVLWGMAAGYDLYGEKEIASPSNHLVSISNPNTAKFATSKEIQAVFKGYYWRDVNLDGIVEWPPNVTPGTDVFDNANKLLFKSKDAWILHKNRNKYSAVP